MTTRRKFSVRFSCTGDANDRARHSVHLGAIATAVQSQPKYAILDEVPFHTQAEIAAGQSADCFLQVWELDFYKTSRFLVDEETDLQPPRNQLVASIPGAVVKIGASDFRFKAAEFPGGSVDRKKGSVTLSLERLGGTGTGEFVLPMPEYESVFELFGVLRKDGEDRRVATYGDASVYPVQNIEASLRQQIKNRGGFAVAFVVDFGPNPPSNNAEFARQAEEMIPTLPTFKLSGGEVKMGYHLWTSYLQLPPILNDLRNAVRDLLGLADPPKVAVLAMYGHGVRQKLLINPAGYNAPGSLRVDRVPDFVQRASPHLSTDVVVPIFACNTGAGPQPNPDNRYGQPHPCEELGADSLAWTLQRELVRQGIANPTVWAHTTAAHTTRNPRLRVFSQSGTADFVNVLFKTPRVAKVTLDAYFEAVKPLEEYTAAQADLFRRRLHAANLIRRISLQHSMYLPWTWNGAMVGSRLWSFATSWTAGGVAEARAVLDELRALVPGEAHVVPDDVVFATGGWLGPARAYILGLRDGLKDATLSQNFSYSEFEALAKPMRIQVGLMRALQLLRYRTQRGLTPQALLDRGERIAVKVTPDNQASRTAVLHEANRMVNEGLLDAAAAIKGLLHFTGRETA